MTSFPGSVTASYLSTVLNLKEGAAKQVLGNLKKLGLVDEAGNTTDLANRWRDDEQYASVCTEILEVAYPEELRQAVPGPTPDQASAARWFQQSHRLGQGAANNAARTYVLVASADLEQKQKKGKGSGGAAKAAKAVDPPKRKARRSLPNGDASSGVEPSLPLPVPQIAVQVNISPDMTPDQIESVFASMAKHFYGGAPAGR